MNKNSASKWVSAWPAFLKLIFGAKFVAKKRIDPSLISWLNEFVGPLIKTTAQYVFFGKQVEREAVKMTARPAPPSLRLIDRCVLTDDTYSDQIDYTQSRHPCNLSDYPLRRAPGGCGQTMVSDVERQQIIIRYLPRSKSYIAARIETPRALFDEIVFDHLIVFRHLAFRRNQCTQSVSMFFSNGLLDDGLVGYRIHYRLDGLGQVRNLVEEHFHNEGSSEVSQRTKYDPLTTESWQMESLIDKADDFLKLLDKRDQFVPLPPSHRLLKPVNLQIRKIE